MTRYLVTGGFGFIGSHLVDRLLADPQTERVTVLDAMTYAAQPSNLDQHVHGPRFLTDVTDVQSLRELLHYFPGHDCVLHLAAQSHVDYSIENPLAAFETNALGTGCVLEAARRSGIERVVYVSTDEVYGPALGPDPFPESAPLLPSSAYSAGKAAGELLARAYGTTYGLDVVVTRGANTYGPRQLPEKLIPRAIARALNGERIPLFGDGRQTRDWIHVEDHVAGILTALKQGQAGATYNISARDERTNRSVLEAVLRLTGSRYELIEPVPDRPGHDRRYATENAALLDLGWRPRRQFMDGLKETVAWYLRNPGWLAEARERAGDYA
jgi:dTDP-glucose 4,6-dehydratase